MLCYLLHSPFFPQTDSAVMTFYQKGKFVRQSKTDGRADAQRLLTKIRARKNRQNACAASPVPRRMQFTNAPSASATDYDFTKKSEAGGVSARLGLFYFFRAPLLYVERFFAARRRKFAVDRRKLFRGQLYRVRARVFSRVLGRRAARYRYGVSAAYRPGQ